MAMRLEEAVDRQYTPVVSLYVITQRCASSTHQDQDEAECKPIYWLAHCSRPWLVGAPDTIRYPAPSRRNSNCGLSITRMDPAC